MQTSSTAPFLAALNHVLVNEPENIGLSDSDLFFLANNACQPQEQLLYKDFYRYTNTTAARGQLANAELFGKVELLIKTELVKFKQAINKEVLHDRPTWRRLSWMLSSREKQQQLEHKKMALLLKEESSTATEGLTNAVEEQLEPTNQVLEIAKQEPTTEPPTEEKAEAPNEAPKYDLTTPLSEKWKNRFRPDWPWNLKNTNIIHLTIPQLQEIEAEIMAEKAAGLKHPYERFNYKPQGGLHTDGFFSFTCKGQSRLPNCIFRNKANLTESIVKIMAKQDKQGWVKVNEKLQMGNMK